MSETINHLIDGVTGVALVTGAAAVLNGAFELLVNPRNCLKVITEKTEDQIALRPEKAEGFSLRKPAAPHPN